MADYFYYRGRWALASVLQALGVGKGDKVGLQGFTCTAVPEAIASIGAIPEFFDVEEGSVNCEYKNCSEESLSCLSVIVIQHTYGYEADISRLEYISRKFDIPIVEDCAHINFFENRRDGLNPCIQASFYSFEWGKPIPVGLGGALRLYSNELEKIVSENERTLFDPPILKQVKIELQYYAFKILYRPRFFFAIKKLFEIANLLRLGESNQNNVLNYFHKPVESCWRISPRVRARIAKVESNASQRVQEKNHLNDVYQVYERNLRKWSAQKEVSKGVPLRYPVRVKDKYFVIARARAEGIELSDWYATPVDPLSLQECKSVGWRLDSCPRAFDLCDSVVTLPINARVSLHQAEKSSNFLKLLLEKWNDGVSK